MISYRLLNKICKTRFSEPICKPKLLPLNVYHQQISHDKRGETKKIKFYLVDRYMMHLKKYEKFMFDKFPNAMGSYRSFMDGIKMFIKEVRSYYNIVKLIGKRGKKISCLSRKEIELYDKLPKDMLKLAPILLFSALPFANYVIFPLIYFFPKQLLSSHFWNEQQKNDFNTASLSNRIKYNNLIMVHLRKKIEEIDDKCISELWSKILKSVKNGDEPKADDFLKCQKLFRLKPYNLIYLREKHIKHLLHLHNLNTMRFFRRKRLMEKAMLIREMDLAIVREGGLDTLTSNELQLCCFIRGIDFAGKKDDDIKKLLSQWITISKQVDPLSASLLLHCPILLSYKPLKEIIK